MGKAFVGGLVVAVASALIFYLYTSSCRTTLADQTRQIAALSAQLGKLEQQNNEMRTQLAKVQSEEEALVAQNDQLKKSVATFKATGKMPANLPTDLPAPPK